MAAADLAIVGARIRTLDPANPFATAVAVRDGTIIAVGDDADIRAECDARTELIDGTKLAIVPGLTDSHFHPFWGAEATQGADLTKVKTLDQLRSALAAEQRRVGPDAWVRGWGLVFEVFEETAIRGDLIAEAAGGQPAYVGFFDGHTAVVIPAALALADITGRETFDDFSTVVCDANGIPTGELRENGAMGLVRAAIPEPTAAQRYHWYLAAMRQWNAVGLTGIHAMDGTPATFDPRIGMAWARLRRPGGEPDFTPVLPAQALSPLETLEGYTTEAARTVSEADISGRIKPGSRADLTAFAADPVDCDADDLPALPILLTVVDGEIVYRATDS